MTPAALAPFLRLPRLMRSHGFAVAPDQVAGFIAAVGALGPRDIAQVRRAALALFAVPPERMEAFDMLFRAVFYGQALQVEGDEEDDETEAVEPTDDTMEIDAEEADDPAGEEATRAERLAARDLGLLADPLTQLAREAPRRLPRRLTARRVRGKGHALDMRRILRQAAKYDGEPVELSRTRRKLRQRKLLVLLDVSGSMKDRSDALLGVAHALRQAADRAEIFTLGTRLTRITEALSPADRAQALTRVGRAVADLDGGTRIGEALQAFLAVPRYAGFARGALVVVLSDGLELGEPAHMVEATQRLSRLAWRLHWLTPLAADPDYRPVTAAMQAILPSLDQLGDGSTPRSVAHHILTQATR
ncbi:vWA domain-containing protein [Roseisalinus antarcticus]|uniref:VWA domain containing CoxE-like protein n=1 Tax=Roseisalinus antarcticus TaxID=254357 RepID=A0A1Y5TI47_9RHOB|nr:VWA domain-containing protein [Roseisalinus antarcticus]SLN64210.1 VWA domain containing CoxE-like protein [Roseisalinus antarcticus]